MPRDEAVALMASLAWRGLAGFPMVHEPAGGPPSGRRPATAIGRRGPGSYDPRPNPTRRSAGAIST